MINELFSLFLHSIYIGYSMIRLLYVILLMLAPCYLCAQIRWNQAYQQYINQYKDVAIEQMLKYRIPASITLAQGLLESGAGKSSLARRGNNHFGIKCHGWKGATVYYDDDAKNECFRAYRNAYESYEDHSKFLVGSQRYSSLFRLAVTDYKGWARGLKAAGYATNPQYANRLIDIIQLYRLDEYDHAKRFGKYKAHHGKGGYYAVGIQHQVYQFYDNYYVKAKSGDTFKTLSKELGVSARLLSKYNERDRNDILNEGDIIYLKKKNKKAPKIYKGRVHYVKQGESMYDISQLYCIRLKYLYKINHLPPYYQIRVGDALRLR